MVTILVIVKSSRASGCKMLQELVLWGRVITVSSLNLRVMFHSTPKIRRVYKWCETCTVTDGKQNIPLHLQAFTNRQLPDTEFLLSSFLKVFFLYLPDCNITCFMLVLLLFSLNTATDFNIMPETIPPLLQPNSFLCIFGCVLRHMQIESRCSGQFKRKRLCLSKMEIAFWQSLRNMKLVTVLAKTMQICKTNLRSHAPRSSV